MQSKNEQLPHNQARTQQPKKTWVEPELVSLGDVVESGINAGPFESAKTHTST